MSPPDERAGGSHQRRPRPTAERADYYGRIHESPVRASESAPRGRIIPSEDGRDDELPETEPADPSWGQITALPDREATPLAGEAVDPDALSDVFLRCNCGECYESLSDPLAEGGIAALNAGKTCPDPAPVAVGKAGEIYRAYAVGEVRNEHWSDKLSAARNRYRRIMTTDRELVAEYDGLTTVLLTFRLSPVTREVKVVEDGWLPPLTLDHDLHRRWGDVVKAIRYRVGRKLGLRYEHVAVTAGTRFHATPHRHCLLWIEDPKDLVTAELFEGVMDIHLESTPTAYPEDHEITEGRGGCVSVYHDPPLRPSTANGWGNDDPRQGLGTPAAVYVGSQLPHLSALGDLPTLTDSPNDDSGSGGGESSSGADDYGHIHETLAAEGEDVATAEYRLQRVAEQTAATAWNSPHNWFSTSSGVLDADESCEAVETQNEC